MQENHFVWNRLNSYQCKTIVFKIFSQDLNFLMKRVSQTTHLNLEYKS